MIIPVAKPYLTEKDAQSAYKTILSGWVTQGPRVAEFEEKFAEYIGVKYAVAVSSCTTALHLAMIVAGVGQGDEVICPSLSFIATANAILYVGAKPDFADIDPKTYNINPHEVEKLITSRTKAILVVHQVGFPADITAFKKICQRYHLKMIEDAACAIGSEYQGKKIGSHSNLVCFSFHPRKVITTGDGGMITTSNESYYKKLKMLRQHGMSVDARMRHEAKNIIFEKYDELGYNYRLTDIQAAIGIAQLEKLDSLLKKRRKIAHTYNKVLGKISWVQIPFVRKGDISNYQSYQLLLKKDCPISRDKLMEKLLKKGISTRRGIMASHLEPVYKKIYPHLKLPVTEYVAANSILIPIYAQMTKKEIDYVLQTLVKYLHE
jgi:perosamine synthetase